MGGGSGAATGVGPPPSAGRVSRPLRPTRAGQATSADPFGTSCSDALGKPDGKQ
jgi:hypothetical protein